MNGETYTDRNRSIKFRDSTIFDATRDLEIMNDPYVVSDYHLLDDFIRYNDEKQTKTKAIIKWHNRTITNNDDVLYLGDLSGDEIYQTRDEAVMLAMLINHVRSLYHKNMYMVIGNNDRIEYEQIYNKCGFSKVYRKPILYRTPDRIIIFSHEPINFAETTLKVNSGAKILNIHGHIHGSKEYWDMDCENHLDVYRTLYKHPMRLSELIKFYDTGKYNNLKHVDKKEA